jgi:hypothetical protein
MIPGAAMDISASGPGLPWITFEDKLRARREEVLSSSSRVTKQAAGETPPRKAG